VSWIANVSGLDDDGVVEEVGHRACSQDECFPNAPVHKAWAASLAKDKAAKDAERNAKYAKGLAMREKKVANIEKRLAKTRARLLSADEYERSSAAYDIEWNERDLAYAKREVERWLAKRSI
jgi:Skp family chaperone for outer membrane proteins